MTSGKVLIIGGGPSGLESARCVAELGGEAILIEKRERLGGTPDRENYAKLTHHWRDASEAMAEMAEAVTSNKNVEVKYQCRSEVNDLGALAAFTVEIEAGGAAESIECGRGHRRHGLPAFRSRPRNAILQLLFFSRCHHADRSRKDVEGT